jgi:hypothetical protein
MLLNSDIAVAGAVRHVKGRAVAQLHSRRNAAA